MLTDRWLQRLCASGWLLSGVVAVTAAWQWHAHVRETEERIAETERTRDEAVRRRAAEERVRIARELHDSLTHSISVVKIQAGVAAHLAAKRGEPVPEALLAIREAAGDAARELRETLSVLRRDEPVCGRGLDDLDRLVELGTATGLAVTVAVEGHRRALPTEVDAAAYRIVQEALTNAARHAGAAHVRVRLEYRATTLAVQVDDDGRGVRSDGRGAKVPGLGLIGMRERAAALGGELAAGGGPEGGFRVRADLPVAARS